MQPINLSVMLELSRTLKSEVLVLKDLEIMKEMEQKDILSVHSIGQTYVDVLVLL